LYGLTQADLAVRLADILPALSDTVRIVADNTVSLSLLTPLLYFAHMLPLAWNSTGDDEY